MQLPEDDEDDFLHWRITNMRRVTEAAWAEDGPS